MKNIMNWWRLETYIFILFPIIQGRQAERIFIILARGLLVKVKTIQNLFWKQKMESDSSQMYS